MAEFVQHENDWKSYYNLSEEEKIVFKIKLLAEHLMWAEFEVMDKDVTSFEDALKWALKWTEHQYPYMITALTTDEEHCGDCRQQCCSCTKCHAEDVWKREL